MNQRKGFTLKLHSFIEGPRRGAGTSHLLRRVLVVGLEPTRPKTTDFESVTSANSITPAYCPYIHVIRMGNNNYGLIILRILNPHKISRRLSTHDISIFLNSNVFLRLYSARISLTISGETSATNPGRSNGFIPSLLHALFSF